VFLKFTKKNLRKSVKSVFYTHIAYICYFFKKRELFHFSSKTAQKPNLLASQSHHYIIIRQKPTKKHLPLCGHIPR